MARATAYRWFSDPASRVRYPEDDHYKNGLVITGHLRAAYEHVHAALRARLTEVETQRETARRTDSD